ncbi:MAG: ferrous iron transport protein A [Desulfamplus sp.]|nr:ferrous iron transport protein A [Desulfamplus sp.]
MEMISLRHMKDKQKGIINSVSATGEMGQRIREMGLVPGTEISIQGRAPLYDPVALRIMGFTLTLRNSEADYIMVRVIPDPIIENSGSKPTVANTQTKHKVMENVE